MSKKAISYIRYRIYDMVYDNQHQTYDIVHPVIRYCRWPTISYVARIQMILVYTGIISKSMYSLFLNKKMKNNDFKVIIILSLLSLFYHYHHCFYHFLSLFHYFKIIKFHYLFHNFLLFFIIFSLIIHYYLIDFH